MKNPYNFQLLREKLDEINRNRVRIQDIMKHTGFSEAYVHQILKGQKFNESAVFKIADFLGVPRKALLKSKERRSA